MLQIMPPRPIMVPGPFDDILPLAAQFGRNLKRIFDPQGFKRDEITKGILKGEISADPFVRATTAFKETGNRQQMQLALEAAGLEGTDPTNFDQGIAFGSAGTPVPFQQRVEAGEGKEAVLAERDKRAAQRGALAKGFELDEATSQAIIDADLPTIEAQLRAITARFSTQQLEVTQGYYEKWAQTVALLNPNDRMLLFSGLFAPEFARVLAAREKFTAETLLEMLKARNKGKPDPVEEAKLLMQFQQVLADGLKDFDEADSDSTRAGILLTLQAVRDKMAQIMPGIAFVEISPKRGLDKKIKDALVQAGYPTLFISPLTTMFAEAAQFDNPNDAFEFIAQSPDSREMFAKAVGAVGEKRVKASMAEAIAARKALEGTKEPGRLNLAGSALEKGLTRLALLGGAPVAGFDPAERPTGGPARPVSPARTLEVEASTAASRRDTAAANEVLEILGPNPTFAEVKALLKGGSKQELPVDERRPGGPTSTRVAVTPFEGTEAELNKATMKILEILGQSSE